MPLAAERDGEHAGTYRLDQLSRDAATHVHLFQRRRGEEWADKEGERGEGSWTVDNKDAREPVWVVGLHDAGQAEDSSCESLAVLHVAQAEASAIEDDDCGTRDRRKQEGSDEGKGSGRRSSWA